MTSHLNFSPCINLNTQINDFFNPLISAAGKAGSALHQNLGTIQLVASAAVAIFSLFSAPLTVTIGALAGVALASAETFECDSVLKPLEIIMEFAKKFFGSNELMLSFVGVSLVGLALCSPSQAGTAVKFATALYGGIKGTELCSKGASSENSIN